MVTVVVPWRAGCSDRERAFEWVRSRLSAMGLPVVVAEDDGDPFSKSAAVMRAVRDITDDWLVIHDADVWCDDTWSAVHDLGRFDWVIPHLHVWRLSAEASLRFMAGGQVRSDDAVERHRGVQGGGIVCVRRSALQRVPFDPRFRGWGGEDVSWGHAMRGLVGQPFRYAAVLWHLWHPPAERRTRALPVRDESHDLLMRYLDARGRPDVLEPIVAEARHAVADL
jgi:hypothetical protein